MYDKNSLLYTDFSKRTLVSKYLPIYLYLLTAAHNRKLSNRKSWLLMAFVETYDSMLCDVPFPLCFN